GRRVGPRRVSWREEEYGPGAVPSRPRGALLDEPPRAGAVLWGDTPASFPGAHYSSRDVYFEPKAFRPEGPPLWLGGARMHRRMLRRIVAYGSGLNPLGRPTAQELGPLPYPTAAARPGLRRPELVGASPPVPPAPPRRASPP